MDHSLLWIQTILREFPPVIGLQGIVYYSDIT